MISRTTYICHRCVFRRSLQSALQLRVQSTGPKFLADGLLRRAQQLSNEHSELEKQLANGYDKKLATRAGRLASVSRSLREYQNFIAALRELREMLADRNLDPELRPLAVSDIASTESSLSALATTITQSLVQPHPFAHLSALVEIRPGTGGSEASLFAGDLLKLYTMYCANIRNWPLSMVSLTAGTEGGDGVQEAIFEVEASGAYEIFRGEAGVHRVQRVPATEKQGRTHTSTVNVVVLPSFPEVQLGEGEEDPDSIIDMKDVRVDVMRARGAGGQHVNTTDSAVRMTHFPTGIVAAIQDSRSQHKNRAKAMMVLKSRIAEKRRAEREAEELALRRSVAKVNAGRSDKMRTYNYIQNRVTDHRCGFSLHDLPSFMQGETLDSMIDRVRKWQMERDVENLDTR